MIKIPHQRGDLQKAWAADYIGISKKNAYFGIDMQNPNRDISSIIQEGLKRNAEIIPAINMK